MSEPPEGIPDEAGADGRRPGLDDEAALSQIGGQPGLDDEKTLSHMERGEARMVDVSAKPATERTASARAFVSMSPEALDLVKEDAMGKGDVLGVARIAGIMAAKKTADLIPLCHPLSLSEIRVNLSLTDHGVRIESSAKTTGPTGVEMEAMTAAAVAALTVYDMCKSADRSIRIESVELAWKAGGRSGAWSRPV